MGGRFDDRMKGERCDMGNEIGGMRFLIYFVVLIGDFCLFLLFFRTNLYRR